MDDYSDDSLEIYSESSTDNSWAEYRRQQILDEQYRRFGEEDWDFSSSDEDYEADAYEEQNRDRPREVTTLSQVRVPMSDLLNQHSSRLISQAPASTRQNSSRVPTQRPTAPDPDQLQHTNCRARTALSSVPAMHTLVDSSAIRSVIDGVGPTSRLFRGQTWLELAEIFKDQQVMSGSSVKTNDQVQCTQIVNTLAVSLANARCMTIDSPVFYPYVKSSGRKGDRAAGIRWITLYLLNGYPARAGDMPSTIGVAQVRQTRRQVPTPARTAGRPTIREPTRPASSSTAARASQPSTVKLKATPPGSRVIRSDPFIRSRTVLGRWALNAANIVKSGQTVEFDLALSQKAIELIKREAELPCPVTQKEKDTDSEFSDDDEATDIDEDPAKNVILLRYDSNEILPWIEADSVKVSCLGQTVSVASDAMKRAAKPVKPVYGEENSKIVPRSVDLTESILHLVSSMAKIGINSASPYQFTVSLSLSPDRFFQHPNSFNSGILFVESGVLFTPWALAQVVHAVDPMVSANPTISQADPAEESDDDLDDLAVQFSLLDPLAFTRMDIPCRSVHCTHPSCFDILVFLEFGSDTANFNCPICNKQALPEDLRVDSYMRMLLNMVPDEDSVTISTKDGKVIREGEEIPTERRGTRAAPKIRFVSKRDNIDVPVHHAAPAPRASVQPTPAATAGWTPDVRHTVSGGIGTEGDPFEID
ncbi:hypothetical protein J8273_3577 [Carpediemonas membranifera]|uniref:SP-RING-type domain-containing protein n=1 Tax=Carpediemonas membranifera TaxID=201153 RepID=A0A8J6B171_9EUKA|nr:hypothetical protein J8273_3577 [Carpediemonas membranifera]|eukprot:KAG9393438.1 hypothetical protein J8273_3577 [Carpediemonas membranifera]